MIFRNEHVGGRVTRLLFDLPAIVAGLTALALLAYHGSPRPLHAAAPRGTITVAGVGLDEPENLVYDSAADVYLVSNIRGDPATRDNNGFVTRLSTNGTVMELKWIEGGHDGVTLDAPKGLAIRGDTLAIADLGAVRFFERATGKPIGTQTVPGLVMNDLAFSRDGKLYITDTGPDRSKTPVDTSKDMDAVYRVENGTVHPVARGLRLDRPDGIAIDGSDLLVATFGAERVERISVTDGKVTPDITLPGGKVDGLRRLTDGSLVVTSWDARSVFLVAPGGQPKMILNQLASPAGVALDPRHHRLAVSSMTENKILLLPLE